MGTWQITPNPKIRMTRRDTWSSDKVRPAVVKWREFKTAIAAAGVTVEDGDELTFSMPMPASWNAAKRARHRYQPHRSKPDLDNLIGGLFDAAMPDGDQHIASLGACRKVWADVGAITVFRRQVDS
jgi:Holliday junction resolvase RusA-like endonuclease